MGLVQLGSTSSPTTHFAAPQTYASDFLGGLKIQKSSTPCTNSSEAETALIVGRHEGIKLSDIWTPSLCPTLS